MIIAMYLGAIVAANLLVVWLGPAVSIVNAALFIGLDLTSRDKLHDAWQGRGLIWKMGLLIAAGSLLSWLLNRNAGQIAMASLAAFAAAACVDTLVYHLLRDRAHVVKVNVSNVFSSLTDSLAFPTLAFGAFMPWVVLGQFAAKVIGGAVWSVILLRSKVEGDCNAR